MIIKIEVRLQNEQLLSLELLTKDKETHSWLHDRPELVKSIENEIRSKLFMYDMVHGIK